MSIYPVRIKKWWPPKDRTEENVLSRQLIQSLLPWHPCMKCGDKVKMRNGWVHHSMPFGHGDAWCTEYCLKGKHENNR